MGVVELISNIAQPLAFALIASVWQGILLAAILWVALKLMPKTTASLRFLAWMGVFLAVTLLPVLSFLATSPAHALSHATMDPIATGSAIRRGIELDARWAVALAAVWLVFSLARATGLARNALQLRNLWKRSTPIEVSPDLTPLLSNAGWLRSAQLCTSEEIDQPCVIGFFAPRILVPTWLYKKATPAELAQILLHEVAHLRRFDDWTNLLQQFTLAFFPLNPALVWLNHRLATEREQACDESVIRATHAPRDYATCLTNLAEERMQRRAVALSLGAWEQRSELAGRIHNILRPAEKMSPQKARAIMVALVLTTAGGAVKLGNSSPLVSFADRQTQLPIIEAQQVADAHARFQNVVFRERVTQSLSKTAKLTKQVERRCGAAGQVATEKRNADAPKSGTEEYVSDAMLRRAAMSRMITPGAADSLLGVQHIQTVFFMTQWEASDGQPAVTVIQRVVTIPADSAAQSQLRWYVIQL